MIATPSLTTAGRAAEVAPGLVRVAQSIVNLYFAGVSGAGNREWVLIDAGLPLSANGIARAAADHFGRQSRPAAIVLTHGHFDHVGGLPDLADRWDCPIYAHELELPYLTGGSSYPPPDPAVGGGAMALLSRFYPRGPIDLGHRIHQLPRDGTVPGLPDWRWVFTPGHSPGHVSFFRESDRVLVVGDAFVATRQESAYCAVVQPPEVYRPPAYYTPDWDAAHDSVARLAALRPSLAATGHGVPLRGERLTRGLERLVNNWDRAARPSHGRYIRTPAVTDVIGVRSVPPAVVDRQLIAVAGVGLAMVAGAALYRATQGE